MPPSRDPAAGTATVASRPGQRKRSALGIECTDCVLDRPVERGRVSEGLMREMMRFEVMPDAFDVVQFGRIFGQPLDDEPVGAGGQRCQRELAGMDRPIVLDQHHRLDGLPGLRTIEPPPAELFLCNVLDSCERLMWTPSRSAISARSRAIVQLRRSATGASSNGVATRNAASLFTGAGPDATLAFSASAPSRMTYVEQNRPIARCVRRKSNGLPPTPPPAASGPPSSPARTTS